MGAGLSDAIFEVDGKFVVSQVAHSPSACMQLW